MSSSRPLMDDQSNRSSNRPKESTTEMSQSSKYRTEPIIKSQVNYGGVSTSGTEPQIGVPISRSNMTSNLSTTSMNEKRADYIVQNTFDGPDSGLTPEKRDQMKDMLRKYKRVDKNLPQQNSNVKLLNDDLTQARMLIDPSATDIPQEQKVSKWTPWLIISMLHALLGSFFFGYNSSVINIPQDNIKDSVSYHCSDHTIALITTMFTIGGTIGSMLGGNLADYIGRKLVFLLMDVIIIGACVVFYIFAEKNLVAFLVGRALLGVAGGMSTSIGGAYLGEISPISIRGTVGSTYQFMCVIGSVVAPILGYRGVLGSQSNWKILISLPLVFCALQILLFFTIIESPKYYLTKEDINSARNALEKLRGTDKVDFELKGMLKTIRKKTQANKSINSEEESQSTSINQPLIASDSTVDTKTFIKILMLSCSIQVFQQLSGINAVIYYSSNIFKKAGLKSYTLNWIGVVGVNIFMFFACIPAPILIEKLGRKPILYISAGGMLVASVLLSVCYELQHISSVFGYLAVPFVAIFSISFQLGLGPVPWLIVGEMVPSQYRGKVNSIASFVNWSCNVGIAYSSLYLLQYTAFWVFGGFCALAMFVVYKYMPETKGKDEVEILKEIQGY